MNEPLTARAVPTWEVLLTLLVLCSTGCEGSPLVLGHACPQEGCSESSVQLVNGCHLPIKPPSVEVNGDTTLCWIFSLRKLGDAPDDLIYLTSATPTVKPAGHHVDIRLVSEAALEEPALPDGLLEEDCSAHWKPAEVSRREVAPLLTTASGHSEWDFRDAPLVTTASHRVMIELQYFGRTAESVEVGLELNCQRQPPEFVSQSFAFVRQEREEVLVRPAETENACASCNFSRDVELRTLFRRTHLIDGFLVMLDGDPLWTSADNSPCRTHALEPWRCDFETPLHVSKRDVLEWQCEYLNLEDTSVQVGFGANNECTFFGIYSRSSGGIGGQENCLRRESASESECSTPAL